MHNGMNIHDRLTMDNHETYKSSTTIPRFAYTHKKYLKIYHTTWKLILQLFILLAVHLSLSYNLLSCSSYFTILQNLVTEVYIRILYITNRLNFFKLFINHSKS